MNDVPSLGFALNTATTTGAGQADQAYALLRKAILTGALRPGESLRDENLAEVLGQIGKTPTRDALRKLEQEGLIVIESRKSTKVSDLPATLLQEVFEARLALEKIIAQQAVRNATDAEVAAMRVLASGSTPSGGSTIDADGHMHRLLLGMAHNRFITVAYQRVTDASLRLMHLTGCEMEPDDEHLQTLRQVMEALDARDSDALEHILVSHVHAFRNRVKQALDLN